MRLIDLTGKQIGHWSVLRRTTSNRFGHVRWWCRCRCGFEASRAGGDLRRASVIAGGGCKHCGPTMRRKHVSWIDQWGYVTIYDPEHPQAARSNGCIKEHRVVMQRMIGRATRAGESIHHKNGIRSDNRPENLELWSSSHPGGQRVADKMAWAEEFLAEYSVTPVDRYLARHRA